ncbi:hypothetical protein Rumeso_00860 [Rubellimicrobium mesophilum DSM 19309]|uniref:DNA repair protein n=1 Tax=Rubellimicrobium mesophilum DSM 19309 TaxID=442562 RepID=A0A017HVB4_9RHOB|nr:DNA repair protein [Rubellimicrobium mesophilum]EYD77694.1 hypothetical protein Rumeso_00860 [Rubellimicrobium mesophilum DSM 19309]
MTLSATMQQTVRILHVVSLYVLGLAALAMVVATALSALGVLPWLTLQAGFGDAVSPNAGMIAQIGLTALLAMIAGFFPSSVRVLALEKSHRDFKLSMQDVAEAYHTAHVADRKGVFTLSSEFDQVRERIDYLRQHPDLKLLEADILTLAAQMSQQSHRLAEVYNEQRVARARDFLTQRQAEAEEQQARIGEALKVCREIMRWNSQVELDEAMVASQLQQLDEQLQAALPALGYSLEGTREPEAVHHGPSVTRPDNIVPMGERHAAE